MNPRNLFWLNILFMSGLILPAWGQSLTQEQLLGTWIGESEEKDIAWVRPHDWRITFRADSTAQLIQLTNGAIPRTVKWRIKDLSVQLDTIQFGPGQWRLINDQLLINGWEPQRYRRFVDVPIDSVSVWNTLVNHTWSTDSLQYSLFDDGSVCLKTERIGYKTLHYWQLLPVEKSIFLIIKGTHREPTGNTHYPLQLIQVSANTLTVRGWNGKRWGDFSLTRIDDLQGKDHCEPSGFQLCSTFLAPGEQKYPYYTYRRGRLGAIRRLVAQEFQPVAEVKQSGLVRFRFVVNCQGKAGMFELLTVDENYERCPFDTRITNQLQRIVQEKITDWEPGKGTGDDSHNTYDTVCLLTFRFKDGQIVEIFP